MPITDTSNNFFKQKSKFPIYLQQTGRRQNFTGRTKFRFYLQFFISLDPKTTQSPSMLPHVSRTMCAARISFFEWLQKENGTFWTNSKMCL